MGMAGGDDGRHRWVARQCVDAVGLGGRRGKTRMKAIGRTPPKIDGGEGRLRVVQDRQRAGVVGLQKTRDVDRRLEVEIERFGRSVVDGEAQLETELATILDGAGFNGHPVAVAGLSGRR
ncbi:MAG: hypothetical protein H6R00_3262 [Proteobacteria bacterium]|nr:hypothetical protein [Pseudomonadota bacterium]